MEDILGISWSHIDWVAGRRDEVKGAKSTKRGKYASGKAKCKPFAVFIFMILVKFAEGVGVGVGVSE